MKFFKSAENNLRCFIRALAVRRTEANDSVLAAPFLDGDIGTYGHCASVGHPVFDHRDDFLVVRRCRLGGGKGAHAGGDPEREGHSDDHEIRGWLSHAKFGRDALHDKQVRRWLDHAVVEG